MRCLRYVGYAVHDYFAVFKFYALAYLAHVVGRKRAVEGHVVRFLYVARRVHYAFCHLSVVGEKEQSHRRAVQTAYRVYAFLPCVFHQFHHGAAFFGVVGGGDVVFRFVQQDIYGFFRF